MSVPLKSFFLEHLPLLILAAAGIKQLLIMPVQPKARKAMLNFLQNETCPLVKMSSILATPKADIARVREDFNVTRDAHRESFPMPRRKVICAQVLMLNKAREMRARFQSESSKLCWWKCGAVVISQRPSSLVIHRPMINDVLKCINLSPFNTFFFMIEESDLWPIWK